MKGNQNDAPTVLVAFLVVLLAAGCDDDGLLEPPPARLAAAIDQYIGIFGRGS